MIRLLIAIMCNKVDKILSTERNGGSIMFERNKYLQQLIKGKGNNLVKVITGIRRSGKSYLLNTIFDEYLKKDCLVNERNIIKFAFDSDEDIAKLDKYLPDQPTTYKVGTQKLVNYRKFFLYVKEMTNDKDYIYILLDEIQILDEFVRVLNGFLRHNNFDVYVTGSNSRFLSSQVDTEFAGRGDRIHLLPLSFSEYLTGVDLYKRDALDLFIRYGGIPLVQLKDDDEGKAKEAISVYKETYLKDVKDRHPNIALNNVDETLKVVASMISTPINPTKI